MRDSNFPMHQGDTYTQNKTTISQRETYQVVNAENAVLVRSSPCDRISPIGASYHSNPDDKKSFSYKSMDNMGN